MALAKIKKIQIISANSKKPEIMEVLQNAGCLDIMEVERDGINAAKYKNLSKLQKIELTHANLEFAINLLSKYGEKKGLFSPPLMATLKEIKEKEKNFNHKSITNKCSEIEEYLTKARNNISLFENEIIAYSPWKKLEMEIEKVNETATTNIVIGSVKTNVLNTVMEKLHKLSTLISVEVVDHGALDTYFLIIFNKELEKNIKKILSEYKFTESDIPKYKGLIKDYLKELEEKIKDNEKNIKKAEKELSELAKNLNDLKIIYDYYGWEKEKFETEKKFEETEYSFIINAWIPKEGIKQLEESIEKTTKEFEINEISPKKDEIPPVVITNKKLMIPFEAVTNVYGLPKYNELDPTPFLAAFFILFFALCLTDAGYGLIMFIIMALILKKFNLPVGTKKLVKLLMYGGIATFFVGTIFGGWFGLTPDQVPKILTYTSENGEKMFLFQKVNAITNPILVLVLSLTLGYIQILLGIIIKFAHDFKNNGKKEAVLNSGSWIFMLSGIGFFILASSVQSLSTLTPIGKWWIISATIILIFTQGRNKKSFIAKALFGILSLYSLVGYMGDILSYSRLLALGLATSIIGLAVNTVANLVGGIPYIGWLFMAVVFIGGHTFNLLINALGSFIHSGRLQFVEFFTKFLEGGGRDLKPFCKKSRYIYIKNQ